MYNMLFGHGSLPCILWEKQTKPLLFPAKAACFSLHCLLNFPHLYFENRPSCSVIAFNNIFIYSSAFSNVYDCLGHIHPSLSPPPPPSLKNILSQPQHPPLQLLIYLFSYWTFLINWVQSVIPMYIHGSWSSTGEWAAYRWWCLPKNDLAPLPVIN